MVEFISNDPINKWCLGVDSIQEKGQLLDTREKAVAFAQQICNLLEQSELEQERVILVDEWHEYVGYTSGLEDLIDSAINQVQGIISLVKPQKALIVATAIATARIIHLIPQIDVLNTSSTALISQFLDTSLIDNVQTITFDDFDDVSQKYEFVFCHLGPGTYVKEFFATILNKIQPGGVLLLTNSADFSNAYTAPRSPGNSALKQLQDANKFDIVHYPMPVSFTICTRRMD
jgi:hypothetical protein